MHPDESTPNLLPAPEQGTSSEHWEPERLPSRLGREATPVVRPASYRVKRTRRSRKRSLLVKLSIALCVSVALFFSTVFYFRERIQHRLFPRPVPRMVEVGPGPQSTAGKNIAPVDVKPRPEATLPSGRPR